MSNVPDDWGAYGGTCTECGHYWHASGTYECACVETFRCSHYKVSATLVGLPRIFIENGLPSEHYERCDEEVTDEDELTEVCGERWCKHCVDEDAFKCDVCGGIFPDECLADVNLTTGDYVCTDCDEKCAAEKTRHHAPVEIPIGHLEYIVWVMSNAAKDEPYEGTQPGNAKKWLKKSIDLIEQAVPEEGVE